MKKFITMAAVIAMLAAFTGCSNNNNSVSDSSTASSEATSSTVSESTPADDDNAESDISDITDESSDSADSESSDTAEDNNGETSEGKAAKYAEAALTVGEWPGLESMTDADLIESITGINVSDAEDYYAGLPATSANCEEIIVVKPAAGSEDTVKAAIDNHMAFVTDPMNIYPSQEETVAGAVSGKTADGYYYLIINKSGSDCADALNALEA